MKSSKVSKFDSRKKGHTPGQIFTAWSRPTVKTRFAPSPTGFLHVGGLRTALFAYLFAKKNKGKFLLRIEDTDQERFVEGGIENILRSLQWTGIEADEGVVFHETGSMKHEANDIVEVGKNGPYVQSQRLDIYKKHIDILLEKGHAYRCFCSKERLDELRKVQEASKQPTGYDGRCRELSHETLGMKHEANEPCVVRMKMPQEGETAFDDLVRGHVAFQNKLLDDHVLLKSDGFPTYHFAVVVDDHLMGITHVIRGEEWLPSTPKHIKLYEYFGWDVPQFAHLSLLINEQKQKLSKRHGDVSVEDFKEKGYLPEALVNFIAFLGWNPGDERELFSLKDLEQEFSFEKVSKAAAVFNREKLNWYNQQYIRAMSNEKLAALCQVPENALELVKDRMVTLQDAPAMLQFLFADELTYEPELLIWKKSTRESAKKNLSALSEELNTIAVQEWSKENLEARVGEWLRNEGLGNGDVLWPMRVALSGEKNSPGPYEIAAALGKEKTLARLSAAAARL